MSKRLFNSYIIVLLICKNLIIFGQCPQVEAIMVDACGTEQLNEFVVINSGAMGFNTNNLQVNYDPNNNILDVSNNDINTDVDNLPGEPCGLTNGNITAYSGCSNLISIGPGFQVPPNAIVILQTNAGTQSGIYDFSSICGLDQCVYVISSSCFRSAGAFSNAAAGIRTTIFTIDGCPQTASYMQASLPGGNGAYFLPLSNTYGNDGCVPPPSSPAPAPASVDQPANISVCGGQSVSSIFTGTGALYSWTNTNTLIGLGASGTGDIDFISPNVTSTQIGPTFAQLGPYCQNTTPVYFTFELDQWGTYNRYMVTTGNKYQLL
jgi:hypothetical protein